MVGEGLLRGWGATGGLQWAVAVVGGLDGHEAATNTVNVGLVSHVAYGWLVTAMSNTLPGSGREAGASRWGCGARTQPLSLLWVSTAGCVYVLG